MNSLATLAYGGAVFCFFVLGYLLGARRGRDARSGLLKELQTRQLLATDLEEKLKVSTTLLEGTRTEVALQKAELREREQVYDEEKRKWESALASERARSAVARASGEEAVRRLEAEVSRERARSEVPQTVVDMLAPLVERERVARELQLGIHQGDNRGNLQSILDTIASRSGWSSVVLSDSRGLSLSASRGSNDVESISALSSAALSFSERSVRSGAPADSVLTRGHEGTTTLHQTFDVEGERYVLTVMSLGGPLAADALEPVVGLLRRILVRDAWREAG